jgi:hypothetical protein
MSNLALGFTWEFVLSVACRVQFVYVYAFVFQSLIFTFTISLFSLSFYAVSSK